MWEVHVIETLTKNWWMLTLCSALNATVAVIFFIMFGTDGPLNVRALGGTIALLGAVAMAAGACAIAAGVWRSAKGTCWPLVLNGLAVGALGVIYYYLVRRYPTSLRTIALLIVVMAVSLGTLALIAARTLRRQSHVADGWILGLAAVASAVFALVFLGLGFQWIKLGPGSRLELLWLGAYFGFSVLCMLGLALRLHGQDDSRSGEWEGLAPAVNPKHAH
jgi:uncharacterized membrane protein HdeD (DUF308 family)